MVCMCALHDRVCDHHASQRHAATAYNSDQCAFSDPSDHTHHIIDTTLMVRLRANVESSGHAHQCEAKDPCLGRLAPSPSKQRLVLITKRPSDRTSCETINRYRRPAARKHLARRQPSRAPRRAGAILFIADGAVLLVRDGSAHRLGLCSLLDAGGLDRRLVDCGLRDDRRCLL